MKSNRGFLNFSHNKVTIQAEINPKNPSRKYVSKITGTGVVVSSDNGIYSFLMPVENGTWTVNRFPSMPQDFLRIKSN